MNLERLAELVIPPVEHAYSARDSMLYALGLGYGADPTNRSDLRYVYEQGPTPLQAVPSLCMVLAHPGFWARQPELAIDWVKILHGEQRFEMHAPLAAEGRVRGEFAVVAVEDKGAEKGAVVHLAKQLFDTASGAHLATVTSVLFLRGDGGCGSFGKAPLAPEPLPDGPPDRHETLTTLPQSALLYRLSGDYNPIHADPDAAARAGFERPILHGLCTMGMAVRSAMNLLTDGAPERIKSVAARFSKPVYPGETLRTELHGTGNTVRMRVRAVERDVVVLDRGTVTLA